MAMARKCGASACNSSTMTAELCWLMWLTITTGPLPQARQWICPAKVLARPRSMLRVTRLLYSSLTLAALMTAAHLTTSSLRKACSSAVVPPPTTPPTFS